MWWLWLWNQYLSKWVFAGWDNSMAVIESIERPQWIIIMFVMMVIGFSMMRGYGSQKKY